MTFKVRPMIAGAAMGAAMVFLLSLVSVAGLPAEASAKAGQTGPTQGALLSETVFKDVQVLKGIPADEFMDAMGMFSASLGYDCVACHSPDIKDDRAAFAITTPQIRRARQMVTMMNSINETNFGGRPLVTCFTCHHAQFPPESIPNLALQYGDVIDDPNSIRIALDRRFTVDQIVDKYVQALGGAQRLAALTSYSARGTLSGFNTSGNEAPIEIVAKAPNQRVETIRTLEGTNVKTYDGRTAWAAEDWRPLPLMPLTWWESRRGPRRCADVVSRHHQAGVQSLASRILDDRRSTCSNPPGHQCRSESRELLFRPIRPAGASDAVEQDARGHRADADRLLRLPRRRGGQDALQDRRNLDERTEHDSADPDTTKHPGRRGEVRQARAIPATVMGGAGGTTWSTVTAARPSPDQCPSGLPAVLCR